VIGRPKGGLVFAWAMASPTRPNGRPMCMASPTPPCSAATSDVRGGHVRIAALQRAGLRLDGRDRKAARRDAKALENPLGRPPVGCPAMTTRA